ncbi:hypothetical protein LCL89_02315 [Halobacillus yeomjeoni]|uniref:IucA/IucC family protein n=1 Tax=Halobacillus yeomjeoni TaxID=311194 RepID=UPI001CD7796F|nr:IucA/IucC family protein [Halobacillus yeomjeoni]MCA0982874.1 hypothetical protein [Halobacillus yeomjeoni]
MEATLTNPMDYCSTVQSYLKRQHPHMFEAFHENMKMAEETILHQLIQAVIREQLVKVDWGIDSNTIHVLLGGEAFIEVPVSKVSALHKIEIQGEIVLIDYKGSKEPLVCPEQLLSVLGQQKGISQLDEDAPFINEIENSKVNYALALTAADERKRELKKETGSVEDTFAFVLEESKRDIQFSPLNFFEQWVIQGHSIHPCSRTRLGMDVEALTQFAPEWAGSPKVIPMAVDQDYCKITNMEKRSLTEIILNEYPEVEQQFYTILKQKGKDTERYELIIVHPWQYEETIKENYKEEIKNEMVIPLESATIDTAALVSFRSLAPLYDKNKHHIKTALNVQMTSAVRTVSAASTFNGPKISNALRSIKENDPYLARTFGFAREESGIHFEPQHPVTPERRHFLQKNFASIIRENPESDLYEDEVVLPAATLIAESPFTDRILIEELVRNFAQREEMESLGEAAERFMEKYVDVLLPGILSLITKYGISMEVHMQNCLVVLKKGVPERIIVRDNGGIRIMEERLSSHYSMESLDPSTNLTTDDRQELLDIFYHAIIHNHLGELFVPLSRELEINEWKLWKVVKTGVEKVYETLKSKNSFSMDQLEDEDIILQSPSRMKALVRMRLTDQFTENAYVDIPNPLRWVKEEEGK